VIAEMRRERVGFAEGKDQRAHGVEGTARQQQQDRIQTEALVDRTDQEDDQPAHQQKAKVRHPDRNAREEDRFERDEKDRQTPDDSEQEPAGCTAEDRQTEGRVGPGDQDVNGIVIEDAEDSQVFMEEQEEMQQAAEQEG